MKLAKITTAILLLLVLGSCGNQEEEAEIIDQSESSLHQGAHLNGADSTKMDTEMGSDREGIKEKDLDKKSADFDPDEVKLGKENE